MHSSLAVSLLLYTLGLLHCITYGIKYLYSDGLMTLCRFVVNVGCVVVDWSLCPVGMLSVSTAVRLPCCVVVGGRGRLLWKGTLGGSKERRRRGWRAR